MVRPPEPGGLLIEVLANPLNSVNQLRAERAMAQIQANIESAQRRAEAQYERAISEAKRTGKSQEVDGVTLGDEGVAGAKIDAESHVAIEVAFNQPSYHYTVSSGTMPNPSVQLRSLIAGAVDVVTLAVQYLQGGRDRGRAILRGPNICLPGTSGETGDNRGARIRRLTSSSPRRHRLATRQRFRHWWCAFGATRR